MGSLWQDLRYAARVLRKAPGFTAVAVVLLALGAGANTAVFSVVYSVLLRPLPYLQPERLVRMVRSADSGAVTVPEYLFWRDHAAAFESVGAYRAMLDRSLDSGSSVEWIRAMLVTPGFFRTLGAAPARGREFTDEEAAAGGPQAIVLTDSLWRRAFGGRADAVGSTVLLDRESYRVVGVLPPNFWFPDTPDAFVPLRFLGTITDSGTNTAMIARLKPGIGLQQAATETQPLTEAFLQTKPQYLTRGYRGLSPISYQDWLARGGDLRTILLALLSAVFLLLLIACSNLAGLLLARLANRRREIAVRLALGSSASRLLRQFLLENILTGAMGGVAGLLCATWLLQALLAMLPFQRLPVAEPVRLNLPLLSVMLGAAIAANLLFGFVPLLGSSRAPIAEALKSGNLQTGERQRMRGAFVTGQVAVSVALSISAALLIQSLYRLHQQRLGFSPEGVMTFWTPASLERRGKPEEFRRFYGAVADKLRGLPGVRSVAAVNTLPLTEPNNFPTQRDGHPEQSVGGMEIRAVTPDYFRTMGTRVVRGRAFTESDAAGTAPVILVTESLAQRWWGPADPVGDRVDIGLFRGRRLTDDPPREVVGVVEDSMRLSLKSPFQPTVYVPAVQWTSGNINWVLRGDFGPDFAQQLRRAIAEIDPRQRVERIQALRDIVALSTADSRFDAWLFGSFAGVALLLTAVGIYGLLSFSVARRTGEIGTRVALGANPAHVRRLVLRQAAGPVALGVVAGIGGALALTRPLQSLLFGVHAVNPFTYTAVPALVFAVGLLASYLPARRATKIDPLIALRTE
ncbi:MAG TPA: ABC transporter permease [Bryobacteraceae bacterium]|jgi:predicted permease